MTREEIINGFDCEKNIVYVPECFQEEKRKNAVIFTHILKAGGSQVAVESLIPLLMEEGYNVYVVSKEDGIYTDRLIENYGVCVIIQSEVVVGEEYRRFLQTSFDVVFLNANPSGIFAYYFINTEVPVFWWMHESTKVIVDGMNKGLPHHCMMSDNFHYLSPWRRVAHEFEQAFERKMDILPIGTVDTYEDKVESAGETVFLFPGSYMNFKGFPIALEAIFKLPIEIFSKSRFIFVGYVIDETLYAEMQNIADKYENIDVIGDVSYEEMDVYQKNADVVVVPSLIESGPLVAVEGLMNENICIISDAAGISDYLHDCVDSFVYPANDVNELYKRMLIAASDKEKMTGIAKAGRNVYAENFTPLREYEFLKVLLHKYVNSR